MTAGQGRLVSALIAGREGGFPSPATNLRHSSLTAALRARARRLTPGSMLARQPSSSIMRGKVNRVAFEGIGHNLTLTAQAGQLQGLRKLTRRMG